MFGLQPPCDRRCDRRATAPQVIALGLQSLVEAEPLPLMTMRTIMQALVYHPKLAEFAMDLLRRLLARRVWTMPRLWTGFVKCCAMSVPHSLPVLLALPKEQLVAALEQQPDLKEQLVPYAATHLASVPPEALEALGLTEDD